MERPKGRITLRMEPSNVERMDDFLEKSADFSSRSQLCRAALENYINLLEKKSDKVLVQIPGSFLEMIDDFVEKGYFNSRDEAISDCLRKHFTREAISKIIEDLVAIGKATGRIPTIQLNDREETIPR